jgi:hypothetical protein
VKKHSEFIGFPIELYVEKSKEKEVTVEEEEEEKKDEEGKEGDEPKIEEVERKKKKVVRKTAAKKKVVRKAAKKKVTKRKVAKKYKDHLIAFFSQVQRSSNVETAGVRLVYNASKNNITSNTKVLR